MNFVEGLAGPDKMRKHRKWDGSKLKMDIMDFCCGSKSSENKMREHGKWDGSKWKEILWFSNWKWTLWFFVGDQSV